MDLDSQPKPLSKLISLITELVNPTYSDSVAPDADELINLLYKMMDLEPEPELISIIYQILSHVSYMVMNSKYENFIFLCPQAEVSVGAYNILHIVEDSRLPSSGYDKWKCLYMKGLIIRLTTEEDASTAYFLCEGCLGQNHEKATYEIKHPLHPKHSLQLVYFEESSGKRKCHCCDEDLDQYIYCCLPCNFAINIACVKKPQVLSIPHSKWHEHPLALFSRTTSLICDVCALVDSTSAIYICPPCGFVVHQRCINLPRVIKISRHPQHRISFTPSFSQGDRSCGICRKEICNDYGAYSCIQNGCSYAAHSKCATQSNVWDGEDLEEVPEDDIEDVEPFVRISDGIIQHFSHQEHHMRLDENTDRDYNEDKLCQACLTPIYFGNFYSCMQCDGFILHEECANCPRKMYHPIHPHLLTLVRQDFPRSRKECSACPRYCVDGLLYDCRREGCDFQVHVKCGVISEPLVHASHMHPLFLTSKPKEWRKCSVCKEPRNWYITSETVNCIECEFSLCFGCATIPQKLRYKHDKHTFSLSYNGEETSTMVSWCEVCEEKIDTEKGFYMCDEDCCVTLHIKCTIGNDLYMRPGSSWFNGYDKVDVVPNKQQMTRPICSYCKRRCPKAFLQVLGTGIFCSTSCMFRVHKRYA